MDKLQTEIRLSYVKRTTVMFVLFLSSLVVRLSMRCYGDVGYYLGHISVPFFDLPVPCLILYTLMYFLRDSLLSYKVCLSLFGSLVVIPIFLLMEKKFGVTSAVVASTLVCFSAYPVELAYFGGLKNIVGNFFAVMGIFFIYNVVKNHKRKDLMFYVICFILTFFSHTLSVFMLGLFSVGALFAYRFKFNKKEKVLIILTVAISLVTALIMTRLALHIPMLHALRGYTKARYLLQPSISIDWLAALLNKLYVFPLIIVIIRPRGRFLSLISCVGLAFIVLATCYEFAAYRFYWMIYIPMSFVLGEQVTEKEGWFPIFCLFYLLTAGIGFIVQVI